MTNVIFIDIKLDIDIDRNYTKKMHCLLCLDSVPQCATQSQSVLTFVPLMQCTLSSPRKAQAPAGRPREAWASDELRRYHTRPLRLNYGPENVHFGKTLFKDPNINVGVLFFGGKFKLNFTFTFLHLFNF